LSLVTILHVVDLPVGNPWLNGVAIHHDRTRFRHLVVSLGPESELHEQLSQRDVDAFALDATKKADYPGAIYRLARLLRREKVDIVQTHLFWPSVLGLAAGSIARTRVKLVTRHHSDFTTTFNHPWHRRADRVQALWADKVLAASAAVKRDMVNLEHVPPHKIEVARYGYDFTTLRPALDSEDRSRLRAELGASEAGPLVATIARLSPSKGHQYLFRALPPVIGRHPGLVLALAGTGPDGDELRSLAADLGIVDHVRFLGWRSDAPAIMEAADLIVHPSLHEAFCSVIIESMALERPLIASNIAAAPEQIDDGETGLLVPARDPDSITEAMLKVLDDPAWAAELGSEARRRVVERFNFPKMMREYEAMYDEALAGAR
jgi:glycosyltransferase involved in cell wall biosynthesis